MRLCKPVGLLVFLILAVNILHLQSVAGDIPNPWAKISKVNAPATIATGQQFTVSVSASYFLPYQFTNRYQAPLIAIEDNGLTIFTNRPFATIANSCPYSTGRVWNVSVCLNPTDTVTFTLVAPTTPTTWNLWAKAMVIDMSNFGRVGDPDVKNFQVAVIAGQVQAVTSSSTSQIQPTISSAYTTPIRAQSSQSTSIPSPTSTIDTSILYYVVIIAVVLPALIVYLRSDKKQKLNQPMKSELTKSFCIGCGKELLPNSKFCNDCGTKQP